MRQIITLLITGALLSGCDETAGVREKSAEPETKPASASQSAAATEQLTSIEWIDSVQNYGKINEGQVLNVAFRFKNTGDKPLVIKDVRPGCGCTAADRPDKPILPGEEGVIKATFDSKGRPGIQKKDITVIANTADISSHVVHFDVEVLAKKTE